MKYEQTPGFCFDDRVVPVGGKINIHLPFSVCNETGETLYIMTHVRMTVDSVDENGDVHFSLVANHVAVEKETCDESGNLSDHDRIIIPGRAEHN